MIRVVLLHLFLLLLPTLLYFSYVAALRWIQGNGKKDEPVEAAPFFWLFAAGLALMIGSLVYYTEFSRQDGRGVYKPPVFRDGVVEPGRVE